MKDLDNSHALFDLYFAVRSLPGWLADCVEAGFSDEEIEYLERLAGDMEAYAPWEEVAAWRREVDRDGGPAAHFAADDDEKIRVLSRLIAEIYNDYERHRMNDGPYVERALLLKLRNPEALERLCRSVRGRQIHNAEGFEAMSRRYSPPDHVTDQDIERARAYPLEKLIPDFDQSRYGYVRCRWHEDKRPSMLVKNGFGYCFTCAKSVDSIGWLIEVDGLVFIDAVKYLRGRS